MSELTYMSCNSGVVSQTDTARADRYVMQQWCGVSNKHNARTDRYVMQRVVSDDVLRTSIKTGDVSGNANAVSVVSQSALTQIK